MSKAENLNLSYEEFEERLSCLNNSVWKGSLKEFFSNIQEGEDIRNYDEFVYQVLLDLSDPEKGNQGELYIEEPRFKKISWLKSRDLEFLERSYGVEDIGRTKDYHSNILKSIYNIFPNKIDKREKEHKAIYHLEELKPEDLRGLKEFVTNYEEL